MMCYVEIGTCWHYYYYYFSSLHQTIYIRQAQYKEVYKPAY